MKQITLFSTAAMLILLLISSGCSKTKNPIEPAAGVITGATGKIAFGSYPAGNWEVYVMNADGSGQTDLTNNPAKEGGVSSWSPDGKKLVFSSNRDNNDEIYVMNSDGSGQTNLTNNSNSDVIPAWSPIGGHIAFESQRDGNGYYEIYSMNEDGTDPQRLTNNHIVDDAQPVCAQGTAGLGHFHDRISQGRGFDFRSSPRELDLYRNVPLGKRECRYVHHFRRNH